MIRDRIAKIEENIARICQKSGRNPKEITLVGVTKYSTTAQIQEAIKAGLKHVAENRVQEAVQKFPLLKSVTKHLIGHLQTNKVKAALTVVDLIQSVDSLKLAQEIAKHAQKLNRSIDVLIEVNTSGEEQKYGLKSEDVLPLLQALQPLKEIRVRGLMTMAPYTDDQAIMRRCFQLLRKMRDHVSQNFAGSSQVQMKYLSMGMSGDYEIAIEEGSNMVRIGSAIFKEN